MIVRIFTDTSALAKRYIQEPGSDRLAQIFVESTTIFVSILTLPELCSALNRLRREKTVKHSQYIRAKEAIMKDFNDFSVLDLTPEVVATSITLLEQNPLKSFDALQIACAVEIQAGAFVTADRQQQQAARKSKLNVLTV